jgi:hypothetical protein
MTRKRLFRVKEVMRITQRIGATHLSRSTDDVVH